MIFYMSMWTLPLHLQDNVLAVDLEWRPDFRKGSCSQVALVQLSSSRHALLIRSCRLSATAKGMLATFLRYAHQRTVKALALRWADAVAYPCIAVHVYISQHSSIQLHICISIQGSLQASLPS